MGRTSKPLNILVVHPELWAAGEHVFLELKEKGHQVSFLDLSDWDLVMGLQTWRMSEPMLDYIPAVLKEVRKVKYGSK